MCRTYERRQLIVDGDDESIRGGHGQQVRVSLVHRRTLAAD